MRNLKSPFCWNICGMISKLCKKYKMAASSFAQAIKFDPGNQTILREATNLWLLSRNFEKHVELRKEMLMMKSSFKMNWAGMIVSTHLAEKYDLALNAVDQ
jgi:tetratricopeptide (TPR) repeat protein